MTTVSVLLPKPLDTWVQERIDSGLYASATDYVSDLIRRDRSRNDENASLIDALVDGERSGVSKRKILEILEAIRSDLGFATGD